MLYNTGTFHKDSAQFIIAGFRGEPLPITKDPSWAVSGGPDSTGGKTKGTGKFAKGNPPGGSQSDSSKNS
jgi:hypothetical protein